MLVIRLSRRPGSTRPVPLLAIVTLVIGTVTVLSLWLNITLTPDNQSLAFFSTFSRAWELAFGGLIAVLGTRVLRLRFTHRALLSWVGVALLAWCYLTYSEDMGFPGTAVIVPVVATGLVIIGCTSSANGLAPGAGKPLSAGWLRYAGRISYSWYCWHWPVLVLAAYWVGHPLTFKQAAFCVLLGLGLAVATYYLVEAPIRTSKALRPPKVTLMLWVGLTAAVLVAAFALNTSGSASASDATGVQDGTELLDSLPPGIAAPPPSQGDGHPWTTAQAARTGAARGSSPSTSRPVRTCSWTSGARASPRSPRPTC